jgi:hypothetical protein
LDVKRSVANCKGFRNKSYLVQTFQASKVPNLVGNLMPKSHANRVSSCHPFDDVSRVT